MGFRNDLYSDTLAYEHFSINDQPRWQIYWKRCDESDKGYISFKTKACRSVDILAISIQIVKDPNPRMRMMAEIQDDDSLNFFNKLRKAGFSNGIFYKRDDHTVLAGFYCDFDESVQSQECVRKFLSCLIEYSRHDTGWDYLNKSEVARSIIADAIDGLAVKYGMQAPCFGNLICVYKFRLWCYIMRLAVYIRKLSYV